MGWFAKRKIAIALASSLAIPIVHADLISSLGNIFNKIIYFGSFAWLPGVESGNMLLMLIRFLITIMIFAIFYAVIQHVDALKPLKEPNPAIGAIVAMILAIISGIFIPLEALGAIGAGWATAISLILIGGPVVLIMYMVYKIPGELGMSGEDDMKAARFIQFALCFLLFWILSAMLHYLNALKITGVS